MARDVAMATLFGAGTILDVFIVAFRLPNLTRQLFGEGALTTAFLPVFLREQKERGDQSARATLTAVAIALASFLSLIVVFSEGVIAWSLFSLSLSDSTRLLLQLLAILLPYMVFICTAALLSAALHAMRIFLWPALVPVVLNLLWLSGVWLAYTITEDEDQRVQIVAATITIAGFCQFLLPLLILQQMRMCLTRHWREGWPRVKEVLTTMLPVIAGISVMQLNVVLDSFMAWGLSAPDGGGLAPLAVLGLPALLPSGTTTELYIGQRMYQFPLGVFGIALGTVMFPLLTQHAQAGEMDALRQDLTKGIRLTIAIAIPASVGLWMLSLPLTNVLFRHGEFNAEDTRLTAQMIATYGGGVWAYIGLTILNRAFYATGDRMTPMQFGLIALLVNMILNLLLVVPLRGMGLALGSVLAAILQLALTTWSLNVQAGPFDWQLIRGTLWRTVFAAVVMGGVCLLILRISPDVERTSSYAGELLLTLSGGVLSYSLMVRLLGMTELDEVFRRER